MAHFNSPGHNISNTTMTILEKSKKYKLAVQRRKKRNILLENLTISTGDLI